MSSDNPIRLDGRPYRRTRAVAGKPEKRVDVAPTFRFVDLFAGIGGIRGGLMLAGGECVYSVEKDKYARLTYLANWGPLEGERIEDVPSLPVHEVLAAGFPCQPFSLAGVVKKQSLGRAHGFQDPTSGNLFFEIIRLIGGPLDVGDSQPLAEEEADPTATDDDFIEAPLPSMPPVLLLENVRNLLSHDEGRTFRVIRRRLMRSGYEVRYKVINAVHWVPQNRQRIFIVATRRDLLEPFTFPPLPAKRHGLTADMLEDPGNVARYRLTPGVWRALKAHRADHERKGNGFGYGIVTMGQPTRTLSARYYKDGAEILIPWMDGTDPPRRLSPVECSRLMGHNEPYLLRPFDVGEVSQAQAYKQFGNGVVIPVVEWLALAIAEQYGSEFAARFPATA